MFIWSRKFCCVLLMQRTWKRKQPFFSQPVLKSNCLHRTASDWDFALSLASSVVSQPKLYTITNLFTAYRSANLQKCGAAVPERGARKRLNDCVIASHHAAPADSRWLSCTDVIPLPQFVPFRDYMDRTGNHVLSMARLAKDVLAEIPDQFISYMKSRGIKPNPAPPPYTPPGHTHHHTQIWPLVLSTVSARASQS